MYPQTGLDLATCLLIAALTRRIWNTRAAWAALWLAALCPFTANFAAAPLTETPEIFCTALAFYALVRFLEAPHWRWALTLACAWSFAALLRPDGALLAVALCPAIVLYGYRRWGPMPMLAGLSLVDCSPFFPSSRGPSATNARSMCSSRSPHATPSIPVRAPTPGSIAGPEPFASTWPARPMSTGTPIPTLSTSPTCPRAPSIRQPQYQQTKELLARLQPNHHPHAGNGRAVRRPGRRTHPHPSLPLLRGSARWRASPIWHCAPAQRCSGSSCAGGSSNTTKAKPSFSWAYAALNLAYVIAALIGFLKRPPLRGGILALILLRCTLLATLEAPEPRYTLESSRR